jgi:pantetheine-phosphate adenylyltransferase
MKFEKWQDDVYYFIEPYYNERHRKFHTMDHIKSMFKYYEDRGLPISNEVFLAICFHDIVYDPMRTDNEEKSFEVFEKYYKTTPIFENGLNIAMIENLILSTKDHFNVLENCGIETRNFLIADLNILYSADIGVLIEYENQIFFEYQKYPIECYLENRLKFLWKFYVENQVSLIIELISYVKNKKYKIGIYAGSFNPYHKGHENIVQQAERVFDKVIIAQGYNRDKPRESANIESNREVVCYSGLLLDLFDSCPTNVEYTLIRGLRNSFDVAYEDNLRCTLWDNKKINIVYFFCEKQYEHISSSMIRSLYEFDEIYWKRYL